MSDIFPKWTNQLPLKVGIGLLLSGGLVTAGAWYYLTPKYSRVGYQPIQPVPFSHAAHVEQLGMDCRYCHTAVDKAAFANVPSTATCMNCHSQVLANDPRLAPVRESAKTGQPIPWVHIYKTPDFVFFNHAVHVNRGVSCVSCHGRVDQMVEVSHATPLSMSFCLDCHRNPAPHLRPLDQVYNLGWTNTTPLQQEANVRYVQEWKINSSQYCFTCHR